MATTVSKVQSELLRTLPDDNVRQILWRFADRYDLQMLVQSAREVASGPVARLVAQGERANHDWTGARTARLITQDRLFTYGHELKLSADIVTQSQARRHRRSS